MKKFFSEKLRRAIQAKIADELTSANAERGERDPIIPPCGLADISVGDLSWIDHIQVVKNFSRITPPVWIRIGRCCSINNLEIDAGMSPLVVEIEDDVAINDCHIDATRHGDGGLSSVHIGRGCRLGAVRLHTSDIGAKNKHEPEVINLGECTYAYGVRIATSSGNIGSNLLLGNDMLLLHGVFQANQPLVTVEECLGDGSVVFVKNATRVVKTGRNAVLLSFGSHYYGSSGECLLGDDAVFVNTTSESPVNFNIGKAATLAICRTYIDQINTLTVKNGSVLTMT